MNILITGGAGFIGANFCHYMLKKYPSYNYVCLDALTYAGNLDFLKDLLPLKNFNFVHGNICDEKLVDELFKENKFDIVVNFAAESHVDRSIETPKLFLQSNVLGVLTLMDACRKYGISRFHQVSTDEVYGDLPLNQKNLMFDENSPLHASSPYSASKASADLFVLAYFRTYNLPVTISRSTNNYGEFQYPEKLIPMVIQNALLNKKLPIHGNGENVRDWLYVYDHCSAIDLILHHGKVGEVYNIGCNNEMSNIEIAKTILSELNCPESLISFVNDRPGNDKRYAINSSKIKNELGWSPKFTFKDGMTNTINWYKQNINWLKNICDAKF